jgi:hypothetical protein
LVPDSAPGADAPCPRCGAAFRCGTRDDRPCACTTVTLGADRLAALRREFDGCLCIDCLRALAAADSQAS